MLSPTLPVPVLRERREDGVDEDGVDLGELSCGYAPPPAELPETPCEKSERCGSKKRAEKKGREKVKLKRFLEGHGFTGVQDWIYQEGEKIFPIHMAAELGKWRIFQLLVKEGADVKQKSSKGRIAMDFAKKLNSTAGQNIQDFLQSRERTLTMREFWKVSMVNKPVKL